MGLRIFLSRQADKFLSTQKKDIQERINVLLTKLTEDAFPTSDYDIKKLQGLKHTFRIRLGDIGLIYEFIKEDQEINILKIDFRGSVYKNL